MTSAAERFRLSGEGGFTAAFIVGKYEDVWQHNVKLSKKAVARAYGRVRSGLVEQVGGVGGDYCGRTTNPCRGAAV